MEKQRRDMMNEMAGIVVSKIAARKAKEKFLEKKKESEAVKEKQEKEEKEVINELTDLGLRKNLKSGSEEENSSSESDVEEVSKVEI